jgi:polar amino acid transport system substrate-binding protein
MIRKLSSPALALVALVVVAVVVAGCGSSKKSSTTSSTSATTTSTSTSSSSKLASEVPAKYKGKTLKVAADASYAPNEFIGSNGKTVEGMDAELAQAIAGQLGLKADVVNATFDAIIPGIAAGKYDLGMSSFTDTKEREKTVDFVTYFSAGTSFYVSGSGGPTVNSLADLCGKTVAVEKGTTQQTDSEAQSKKCKSSGKPAVKVLTFNDQNGANLAIQSGRAQVGMADSPVAAYQVKKSGGQFKLSGQPYGTAPYGIAIPKNSGLDKPVLDAVKALIADGTYDKIMKKWGIQAGEIKNPTINGATS